MIKEYIARPNITGSEQILVSTHLHQVAEYAQSLLQRNDLGSVAYLCGILHDAGKYSDAFQAYISNPMIKDGRNRTNKVDHGVFGARILWDYCEELKKN